MRVLSLFSGIGGIDLGLERAGHMVVAQSEVDPYCCRVLAKHWPYVRNLGDVTKIVWSDLLDLNVELVAGGYPCQPFSLAGARQGDRDPRHLWPYMLDAIRVLRPRYAVMENVPGHLSLGFGRVLGDLAESGYNAEWDCIPAAAVGAPHRRDRVWIVAYPSGGELRDEPRRRDGSDPSDSTVAGTHGSPQSVADTDGGRFQNSGFSKSSRVEGSCRRVFDGRRQVRELEHTANGREFWTVEPDVCRVPNGISEGLDSGLNGREWVRTAEGQAQVSEARVRALRDRAQTWLASPRRGPDEQLARELGDALRGLPHPMALGEREAGVEAARYVRGLREACEALGVVRHALVPSQAAWVALPREAQEWIVVGAHRGPWHAEWPDTPRVATGVPHRVDRLRGLGNAVVPQVAEHIGRMLAAA